MRNDRIFAVSVMALIGSVSGVSSAQDVIMRRPIPIGVNGVGHSGWNTDVFRSVDSNGNPVVPACGQFNQTRNVWCQDDTGAHVAEINCKAAKPASSQSAWDESGCTYSWDAQDWVDPGESCSYTEEQTRAVTCLRDLNSQPVADSFCGATKPSTSRQIPDFSSCTYSWHESGFIDPGESCTPAEIQTQTVTCRRDLDGEDVGDSFCGAAGAKPASSKTVVDYSSCTYSWVSAAFVDPGPSCNVAEVQTRSVTCHRDLDGATMSDSMCQGAKPPVTQTVADFESCSYSAANWTGYSFDSTCSGTAKKTRTAQCKRSDGAIVADGECTSRSIALSETIDEANYSTCPNSWTYGAWNEGGASCTASETQPRAVWCKRDVDGAVMPDAGCSGGPKPLASQSVADYSGCSYAAANPSAPSYSSTCSASATKTITSQCRRSDGTIVAASECTSRSISLVATTTEANYGSCSYAWSTDSFVDPGASCTAGEIQTRSVTCRRTLDNASVADGMCAAAKPSTTQSVADYSGCTYYGGPWWGDWTYNSTCSASAIKTQHRTCYRSDGTPMASADPCINSGVPVSQSVYEANYSGCGYNPEYGAFSACDGAQQTRSVVCRRSDGTSVDLGYCGLNASATAQSCVTYGWQYGGWSGFSACDATGNQTQTRAVWCQASNGTVVADSVCGAKPATSNSQSCGVTIDVIYADTTGTCGGVALSSSSIRVNFGGNFWVAVKERDALRELATSYPTARCYKSHNACVNAYGDACNWDYKPYSGRATSGQWRTYDGITPW